MSSPSLTPSPPHPVTQSSPAASGFSFAEVMFAVVILGIGFIMIAAIFPVAIQQSQTTNDESLAAAVARESANTISALPQNISNPVYTNDISAGAAPPPVMPATVPLFPPTVKNYTLGTTLNNPAPPAIVASFSGPRWDAIKNSIILPSDNRYAFVPFYRRENNSSVAQLIVVAVTVRNRSTYDPKLDVISTSASTSITTARGAFAAGPTNTTIYPDTITLPGGAEGWYATLPYGLPANQPAGRTYRLGRQITAAAGGNVFEIEPGDALTEAAGPDGLWGTTDDASPDAPGTYTATLYTTSTLQPVVAYASVYYPPDQSALVGRITLAADAAHAQGTATPNVAPAAAGPGAFVIIADDWPYDPKNPTSATYPLPPNLPAANPPGIVGSLNGHIFRLGQPIPANPTAIPPIPPGTFDLDPAFGMRGPLNASPDTIPSPITSLVNPSGAVTINPWARVFIIGAGLTTPQNLTTGYSGNAQDIAVYTTFIPAQ